MSNTVTSTIRTTGRPSIVRESLVKPSLAGSDTTATHPGRTTTDSRAPEFRIGACHGYPLPRWVLRLPKIGCPSWQVATRRTRTCADPRNASRSLALLRLTVGNGWLGWKHQHPLARQFLTSIQGADPEGVERLSNALACAQTSPMREIRAVLKRLAGKSWSEYDGASFEVRLVASFLKEGPSACLLNEKAGGDFVTTPAERCLKVECKVLQPRADHDAFGDFVQAAMDVCAEKLNELGRTELRFTGWITDVTAHAEDILAALNNLAETPKPAQQTWPGVSLRFEPGTPSQSVPFAGEPRFRRVGHQGDRLELVKLRQCIRSHEGQLRGDTPAIFAVNLRDLLDTTTTPADIEQHVLHGIRDLPHVGGVLCVQEDLVPGTLVKPIRNEPRTLWLVEAPSPAGLRRVAIFVRNPVATSEISESEILAFFRCFVRG